MQLVIVTAVLALVFAVIASSLKVDQTGQQWAKRYFETFAWKEATALMAALVVTAEASPGQEEVKKGKKGWKGRVS